MSRRYRRSELLKAINSGSITRADLKKLSIEDRLAAELLSEFPVAGRDQLADAPETLLKRAYAIAEPAGLSQLEDFVPRLIFDSWVQPAATAVRGTTTVDTRRLRFEVGPVMLDLRGEKELDGWFFTGRLLPEGKLHGWQIQAGKKKITAGEPGFFEWHADRGPQSIKLISDSGETIALPKVQWSRKKKK